MSFSMTTATTARQIGIRQRSLRRHCRLGRATELVFVLATGAVLMLGGQAEAQTWDGQTDANWSTGTNWNPDGVPALAGTVTIDDGGLANQPTVDTNQTVTQTNVSAGTLTVNAVLTSPVTVTGTGNLTISAGGSVAGAVNFGGAGTFDNAGSVTGATTISGGVVNLNAGSNLADDEVLTVNGGTVNVNVDVDPLSFDTVGGLAGTGGAIAFSAGAGALVVDQNGDSTFSGDMTGTTSFADVFFEKLGTGTLTLAGNASMTGAGRMELTAGRLQVANGNAIGDSVIVGMFGGTLELLADEAVGTLATAVGSAIELNDNTLTIRGVGTGVGVTSESQSTIIGTGGLTLDAANLTLRFTTATSYTGDTTILDGTFLLGGDDMIADASAVTVDGGTLDLGGNSDTVASVDMASGLIASTSAAGTLTTTGAYTQSGGTLADGVSVNAGGGQTLAGGIVAGNLTSTTSAVEVTGDTTLTGVISSNSVTVTSGTLTTDGASFALTTAVTVDDGGLTVDGDESFASLEQTGGTITGSGTTITLTGDFDQSGGDTAGTLTVDVGGNFSQSGGATIAAGTEVNATGTQTLGGGTIAGNLTGAGAVEVTGDTDVTGIISSTSVTVTSGTLTTDGASFNTLAAVALGGTGNLALTGDETIGSLAGAAGSGVTLGGNLTTGSNNGTTTMAGNISGSGTLSKEGTGTMTLSGTNTNTGRVFVNAGTLVLSGGNAIGDTTGIAVTGTLQVDTAETIGDLDGSGNVVLNATLTTGGNNFSGVVSGVISGAGGLTKTGTGTMELSGANTYAGATAVNAGVLNIQNGAALGSTAGATTVAAGAALEVQGGITVGEAITLNGTGVAGGGALVNVSGNNAVSGQITLGSGARINSGANQLSLTGGVTGTNQNLTLGGAGNIFVASAITTGSGTLTKDGSGAVALGGANTFTGATSVNAGFLVLQGAANTALSDTAQTSVAAGATLQLNVSETVGSLSGAGSTNLNGAGVTLTTGGDGSATTYSGAIVGDGALTKQGTGTMTLSGANTFTGALTINEGEVLLLGAGDLADGGSVHIGADGTLTSTDADRTIGSLSGDAGGTLDVGLSIFTTGSGTDSTFSGNLVGGATGVFNKDGPGTLTFDGDGSGFDGTFGVAAGAIEVAAGTTLNASAVGAQAGTTLTLGGGVLINADANLNANGTVNINGNETVATLIDIDFDGPSTGTININGAGTTLTLAGGTLPSAHSGQINGTGGLAVTGGDHSLSGDIDLDGSITVDDGSRLVLAGNNTIDGGIFVQGTLRLESDNAAGGTTGLITTLGTIIDYADGVNNVTGISVESDDTQLQVITGTATQTGVIADGPAPTPPARPIEKIGDGTLILAGDNTYTGDTTVSGGVLEITGAIDSAAVIVDAGAGLELGSALVGGALLDTAAVTLNDDGNLTVASDETIGALNGGVDSTAVLTGDLTLASGASTMDGIISGGGGLIVDGGTVTLTNANTYAGDTTVDSGSLTIGNGTTGSITSNVTVAAAGDLTVATNGEVDGDVTSSGAASSNAGTITGTLTVEAGGFSNTGSVGGATTVNDGTLNLDGSTNLADAELLTVNGGTVNVGAGVTEVVGALDGTGGTVALTGNLTAGGNGASTTYAGVISGAGTLTKEGAGTLELSGDSTHTGTLTVNGGVLEITGAIDSPTVAVNTGAVLETNSTAAPHGALVDTAVVTLTGTGNLTVTSDETIGSLNSTSTTSTATLTGNLTLTGDSAMAGIISGAGGLIVDGGTVDLTNANTYTGDTTVNSGRLNVGTAGDDGSITSNVTVAAGGDLAVATASTVTGDVTSSGAASSNAGTITGALTVEAGGFSNTGSVGGATTVNDGTLNLDGSTNLADAELLTVNGGTVNVGAGVTEVVGALAGTGGTVALTGNLTAGGNGASTTYAGVISGAGTLTKEGAGTLELTGTSTHTGTLDVNAGMVNFTGTGSTDSAIVNVRNAATLRTDGGALDTGTDVFVMDTATLDVVAGGTEDFASLTQTGGTVTGAGGTINLTGAFDQSGPTSTTGGTLTITAGSFTQSGGATIADGTVIDSTGPQTLAGGNIDGQLIGSGAATVQTGITTLGSTGVIAANTTIDSQLDMSGTLGGTAANNGLLNVTGGTITGVATNDGTLTIASGSFNGGLINNSTTTAQGTMAGDVTNAGSFDVTGALTASGDSFTNDAAGTVTVAGTDYTGLGAFSNAGSTAVTGGATLGAGSISNTATSFDLAGTLQGSVNNSGTINVNASSAIAGNLNGGGMVDLASAAATDTLALGGAGTTVGAQTFNFNILQNATGAHVVSQAGTIWDGTAKNFVVDLSAGDMALGAEAVLVGGQTGINEVLFGAPIGGFIAYEVVDSGADTVLRAVTNPGVGAIPSGVSLTQSLISNVVNRPSSPFASGLAAEQGCSQGGYFRGIMGRANATGTSTNGTSTSVNTLNARYGGVQGGWDVICNDGRFLNGWDGGVGAIVGYNFGKSDQPVTQLSGGSPVTVLTTHTDFRQSYLGFYAVGSRDRLTLDAQVRFEDTKYTLNETVNIGVGLGLNDSEFSTRGFNFTGRASYRLDLNDDGLSFVPTAGFSLTRTNATELRFTTGNTLTLDAYTSKVGFIGGTLAKSTINEAGDAGSTVFGSLNYYREFGGDRMATANDLASGTSMAIASAPIEGFGEASVGWNYVKILEDGPGGAKQLNANIRADARFGGSVSNSYSLTAQVRLSF